MVSLTAEVPSSMPPHRKKERTLRFIAVAGVSGTDMSCNLSRRMQATADHSRDARVGFPDNFEMIFYHPKSSNAPRGRETFLGASNVENQPLRRLTKPNRFLEPGNHYIQHCSSGRRKLKEHWFKHHSVQAIDSVARIPSGSTPSRKNPSLSSNPSSHRRRGTPASTEAPSFPRSLCSRNHFERQPALFKSKKYPLLPPLSAVTEQRAPIP